MVSLSSELITVVRVVSPAVYGEKPVSLSLLTLAPGGEQRFENDICVSCLVNWLLRGQRSVLVCYLFSMPTVTALFLPRSDLGCALAL